MVFAAALVMLAAIAWWWRSRASYGSTRGLPPGSLGLLDSFRALRDPTFYADAARRHGRVFKMAQFHRPVVCIVDLPLGLEVLESQRDLLRDPSQPFGRRSPGDAIAFLTDERHPRYRSSFSLLDSRFVDGCAASVSELISAELNNAAGSDGIDPNPILDGIASKSLHRCMFDCARDVLLRHNADAANDATLSESLGLIVFATRSNTRGVLGWTLKELVDHPRIMKTIRDATPDEAEALATQVVLETLRQHQSEFLYREVVSELRIGEYRVPRGWLIRVCVRECHDDPSVFNNPGEFRPDRFAHRQYDRTQYIPFSGGSHSTLGSYLTLMIARTLVMVVARDWDVRTTADGPVERAGQRHWQHWRPNRNWRITLRPLA